ncbi:MAG: S8 family peptidase [Lachnospiraceae bacterium]|jgi:subtilisin family serine protease|nr:S8 family peptidase [Lachnospiraceae bacterium]
MGIFSKLGYVMISSGILITREGIDYTSELFRDEEGNSRILSIWDQTIQSGTPPEGFLYGTEYRKETINTALESDDPYAIVPSRDENGHGTCLASVAAGSRVNGGRSFLGGAPDAEIVVVKLKECKQNLREYYLLPDDVPAYAEQDIMLGVKYADSFAMPYRRPVVICLGIGTNMGSHGGKSALSVYLNDIALKSSRAVVMSGGNEGNAAHHYSGILQKEGIGSGYQDVEILVSENHRGFFLEFWGEVPDVFNITIRSPGGETVPSVRLGIRQSITYGFIYENTKVTVDSRLVEPTSGEELIILRIEDPTPGIWNFRVNSVGEVYSGGFHLWLPITQFMTAPATFLAPDPFTTLTPPSVGSGIICVTAYNDANNSFYLESGRGFSRTGAIRPDFAAPGVDVSTIYGKRSGSCLAAALAAGGVAQFMQWAVLGNSGMQTESRESSNYFIRGAIRSSDISYPSREWGYGRLNMVGTFDAMAGV